MSISKQEAGIFLNKYVIIVHADGSSAGKLIMITDSSVILQKNDHKTLVSLNSIEKIKEKESYEV